MPGARRVRGAGETAGGGVRASAAFGWGGEPHGAATGGGGVGHENGAGRRRGAWCGVVGINPGMLPGGMSGGVNREPRLRGERELGCAAEFAADGVVRAGCRAAGVK